MFLWFTRKNIWNARSWKSNCKKPQELMNLTVNCKKTQEVAAMLSISYCSGKRYTSNSWDQIWIYVCLYCENNIVHACLLHTCVFMAPTEKKPFNHLNSLLFRQIMWSNSLGLIRLSPHLHIYTYLILIIYPSERDKSSLVNG